MQILQTLLGIFGKKTLVNLALSILWKALGKIATDALQYVKEAEAHTDYTAAQKYEYVRNALAAKYSNIENWKWIISLATELAVGQLKGTLSATKSAAILKIGG